MMQPRHAAKSMKRAGKSPFLCGRETIITHHRLYGSWRLLISTPSLAGRSVAVRCGLLIHCFLDILVAFGLGTLTPTSVLTGANRDHFVLAIAGIDIQHDRHVEVVGGLARLRRIHSEDINLLILKIQASFVNLFNRLDVELIFSLVILDVFFDLGKVGRKGRPPLRCVNRPEVDAAGLDASCCDERALGVPLDNVLVLI